MTDDFPTFAKGEAVHHPFDDEVYGNVLSQDCGSVYVKWDNGDIDSQGCLALNQCREVDADQPPGIAEDSYDLPSAKDAAERVNDFLSAWGDGLIPLEYDGLPPLYARDLQALTNLATGWRQDA